MNYSLLVEELSNLLPNSQVEVGNTLTSANSIVKAVYVDDLPYIIDKIVPCNYSEAQAAILISKQHLSKKAT